MRVEQVSKVQFKVEWTKNQSDVIVFATEVCKEVEDMLSKSRNNEEYDDILDSHPDALFMETSIENVFFESNEQAMRHLRRYSCAIVERWSYGELDMPDYEKLEPEELDDGGTLFLLKGRSTEAVVRMTYPTIAVL